MSRKDIKIYVQSLLEFKKLMNSNRISDDNVETFTNCAMICIIEPEFKNESHFKKEHKNVINLFFHDCSFNDKGYLKKFSEEDADKIINFVLDRLKDDKLKYFIVHCHAGISRSGAVGEFIQEISGLNYDLFKKENPYILPNPYVKGVLKEKMRTK